MKKRLPVLAVHLLLVVALLMLVCAGCGDSKDNGNNNQPADAPKIPPKSTFVMDFTDFSPGTALNAGGADGSLAVNALGDRSNYDFAALNVGFWNLAGILGLAIPVAAFAESLKQVPVKQPDNSWVWTYSVTVQLVTYTAELHGKYIDSGVRWEMYITKQGEYTDYLWYYGESNLANTEGFWMLKAEYPKGTDLLRIDWHRDPAKETGDIKYTNVVPGGPENGGFISYVVSEDEPFDRSYTIFNKSGNQTTYIEWAFATKAGRVKDSKHFGDDVWHCWDASLKNAVCA